MTYETMKKTWEGEIPVHYLYTFGLAGERFFREVKERGVFVGTKCDACDVTYVPPRVYCERCFADLGDYVDVGTKGTVETFTFCKEKSDGTKLPKDEVIAYIKIDGTDGGLVHRLEGVDRKGVKIGMTVEAIFQETSKRTGSIGDIIGFRPI